MADPVFKELPKHERNERTDADIRSFMCYVPDQDGGHEPGLALASKFPHFHGRNCHIIPLSCAHMYWPETRKQKDWYMNQMLVIVDRLGLAGDPSSQMRVAKTLSSVIESRLQELLEMAEYEVVKKQRETRQPKEIGEVKIMSDGEEISRHPMLNEGLSYEIKQ